MTRATLAFSILACSALALAAEPAAEPVWLDLGKLYVQDGRTARVAPAVEALRGKRVRVLGYMAQMEEAPKGALYLTRYPVEAEEGGAGTGDLPPGALRVEVPRLSGEEIDWVPGVVEAVGTLEVGRAEDGEGRVSWLRVVLDDPPGKPLHHHSTATEAVPQQIFGRRMSP